MTGCKSGYSLLILWWLFAFDGYAQTFSPEMVLVKGGRYNMGTGLGGSDEQPVHDVVLEDFYIGKYEVTQAEWYFVMSDDTSARYFPRCPKCPVERVSWYNVQEFFARLNNVTGMTYRLPTEAEWEYAARGGLLSNGYKYSGSDLADSVAWTDGNSDNRIHTVGEKKPNELGLSDMSGNVWEWCSDWYSPKYYKVSPGEDPTGPEEGEQKVIRGGGWFFDRSGNRVFDREKANPGFRYGYVGFRLCRSVHYW